MLHQALSQIGGQPVLGSTNAIDELLQLAGERNDVNALRRQAYRGSRDAADMSTGLDDQND